MTKSAGKPLFHVQAIDSVETVARMMRDLQTDILPVTRDGCLVGVVTAWDIVTRMVAAGEDTWLARAADYMTREVDVCQADMNMSDAARLFREKNRRLLPVVDEDGRLVGVLTPETLERFIPAPPVSTYTKQHHPVAA